MSGEANKAFQQAATGYAIEELARAEGKKIAAKKLAELHTGNGWTDRQQLMGDKTPPDIFQVEQPGGGYKPLGRSGRWHMVFGASGSAKTFLVAGWAAERLRRGEAVAWFDFEDQGDDLPDMIRAFGVRDHDQLHYFEPEAPPDAGEIVAYCSEHDIGLVVMDAQRGAIKNAVPGEYGNSGDDVELFGKNVVRPLTRAGITVVTIEHVGVSTTTGRPLGSERKISAVDIALEAENVADIYDGAELGYSRLTVRKYRGGFYRKGDVPASMVYKNGRASFRAQVVKPSLEAFTQQNGTVNQDLARIGAVAAYVARIGLVVSQGALVTALMESDPALFTSGTRTKAAVSLAVESGRIVAKPTGTGRAMSYEPAEATGTRAG